MNQTERLMDYSWQGKGYRYTVPVEVTNNQLATQIINASRELAKANGWIERLSVAARCGANCEDQIKEWRQRYLIIETDIRQLAYGNKIDKPWDRPT